MPIFLSDVDPQYIKLSNTKKSHNLSASTVLRLQDTDPTFPRLVVLSPKCKLISVTELNAWIKAQEGKPRGNAIRKAADEAEGREYLTKAKVAA